MGKSPCGGGPFQVGSIYLSRLTWYVVGVWEQEEYEEDDGLLVIAGAASQGGLVGRQELWLAQKRSKIHSKRREQV